MRKQTASSSTLPAAVGIVAGPVRYRMLALENIPPLGRRPRVNKVTADVVVIPTISDIA